MLAAVFASSGAAALIYQVLWPRWLSLIFGNTSVSISVVLAAFMLGQALGSALVGRAVRRVANPLRAYAYAEFGIAAVALAFPLLTRAAELCIRTFLTPESSASQALAIKAAVSLALLGIPTTLMGVTLPLLTELFRRGWHGSPHWNVGFLYAANTVGAAAGALAAGFLLIEVAGIRATTYLGALLNAVSGIWAYRSARSVRPAAPEPAIQAQTARTRAERIVAATLFCSGALMLAAEVLWTRTLEIVMGNSTYAFSMMLVMVLLGISVGSAVVSRFVKRLRNLEVHLVAAFLVMALWTAAAMEGILAIADRSAEQTGLAGIGEFLVRQVGSGALLFPLAFLSGALFPLATRLLDPDARDADASQVARVIAWNTLGALLGSLAAGFAIAPRFEFFHALDLLTAANALVAAALAGVFIAGAATRRRLGAALAAIGIAALALAGWQLRRLERESPLATDFEHRYPEMELVSHRPGLQGVTSVVRARGERLADHLFVNGLGMTVKITDTKMMAHLPLLLHDRPDDTLVICFGMGTTYRSALTHGGRVTAVELVREVVDAFPLFFDDAEQVLRNPRGAISINDGRNYLTLSRSSFDVITIDPPPPIDAAFVSQLYSREFVALARSRLKPGGIFAHWIPFPSTGAGVDDRETFETLLATITSVFPHVLVIPSYQQVGLHVLASSEPLRPDPERIASRLVDPTISRDLQEWDPVPSDYFAGVQPIAARGALEVLTDDRPRIEFYLLRSWRSGIQKPRLSLW